MKNERMEYLKDLVHKGIHSHMRHDLSEDENNKQIKKKEYN